MLSLFFTKLGIAADPPMYIEYQAKIINNIENAWTNVDTEFNGLAGPLSSSVVYYDASKIAWQLAELFPENKITYLNYLPKFAEITARSYISYIFPPSGYTVFPHGIYREWTRTGNPKMFSALTHLYLCKTEISSVSGFCVPNQTYLKESYARDLAYQIHTKIYAEKAGVASDGYLAEFLNYALGMLNGWHTGNLHDPGYQVRQSFMVGLLLSAIIEYYIEYNNDSRIPIAVKTAIDDLWKDAWWPDIRNPVPSDLGDTSNYSNMVAGYGAFKYWMDWHVDHYVWDSNHMANSVDVSPDLNNLIGPAYIWYALYSGDDTYRVKAEQIWKGWVVNGFAEYDKHFNQGSRQVYNFVKWYNKYTGDTCDSNHPWLCESNITCEAKGFNYCNSECIRNDCVINTIAPKILTIEIVL